MNKVISDLSEITSGLSIAVLIPGNKSSTEKKGSLDIFIPSSAKEFLDQLELFEAFLCVVFSKKSFVFKQCKIMRKNFEEHYQFLDSQFDKYGSTCGAHILKAVHNTFNTFFVKVKKDKNFKPQGIKLSLLDRCEEGEDMNLVIQNSNCKREHNHKSNKSNKRNNNNNGYNNNNNNRNNNRNNNNNNNSSNNNNNRDSSNDNNKFKNNWVFRGMFGDHFKPGTIKNFRTKVPSYYGKQLCLKKGIKGFCNDHCRMYHGPVSKTDDQFCKFIADNNLPFTARE